MLLPAAENSGKDGENGGTTAAAEEEEEAIAGNGAGSWGSSHSANRAGLPCPQVLIAHEPPDCIPGGPAGLLIILMGRRLGIEYPLLHVVFQDDGEVGDDLVGLVS